MVDHLKVHRAVLFPVVGGDVFEVSYEGSGQDSANLHCGFALWFPSGRFIFNILVQVFESLLERCIVEATLDHVSSAFELGSLEWFVVSDHVAMGFSFLFNGLQITGVVPYESAFTDIDEHFVFESSLAHDERWFI